MLGALMAVGRGALGEGDLAAKLALGGAQPPGAGGAWRGYQVAPAKGLRLVHVRYPPGADDPSRLLHPDRPHDARGRVCGPARGGGGDDEG
jgi:hypothetical protein